MNERIKELAEQAGMVRGGYANTPEMIMTWREDFDNPGALEKFAKSLLDECILTIQMGITRDGRNTEKYQRSVRHINDIKQHFGIE